MWCLQHNTIQLAFGNRGHKLLSSESGILHHFLLTVWTKLHSPRPALSYFQWGKGLHCTQPSLVPALLFFKHCPRAWRSWAFTVGFSSLLLKCREFFRLLKNILILWSVESEIIKYTHPLPIFPFCGGPFYTQSWSPDTNVLLPLSQLSLKGVGGITFRICIKH